MGIPTPDTNLFANAINIVLEPVGKYIMVLLLTVSLINHGSFCAVVKSILLACDAAADCVVPVKAVMLPELTKPVVCDL